MLRRYEATDDDLKRAYRKIVLTHHPDKRKAKGEDVRQEDDYFTCITRAYEILGNPQKRRSYDSVDPEFDDSLPSESAIKKDFYGTFKRFFDLNGRWSEKRNVPALGDNEAMRDQVDKFYNFWYNFESWREYSYLDEEDKDKGQDRDERRWIEKQNKAIRAKRKKEEMSRIRSLVDLAYNNDPRIVRFKQEEKDKRNATKRAKQDAFQAQKAEEERVLKELQQAKLKAEEAEQKRIEGIRIEREREKKAIKKEKKMFRDFAKGANYFASEADSSDLIRNMEGVEKICEMMKLLELQDLNKRIKEGGKAVFVDTLNEIEAKIEEERDQMFQSNKSTPSSVKVVDKNVMWNPENMQLLIKAVNLFPAGTAQRWDVIANFMNQHSKTSGDRKYTSRDVLNKAKDLQSSDFSKNVLKAQANDNAFESFEKQRKELKKVDIPDPSVNDESNVKVTKKGGDDKGGKAVKNNAPKKEVVGQQVPVKETVAKEPVKETVKKVVKKEEEVSPAKPPAAPVVVNGKGPEPAVTAPANAEEAKGWSKEEQALLEQAIKTYPITTPDRWERIAECIPNRTKRECLRRVKELVDLVNAKQKAQQGVK